MAYGRGERGAGNGGRGGSSRGGGRGGSRGGGRGGGRGAARGGRGLPPPGPVPDKKQAPRFVKIDKLQPGKAAFLLVKVADVDTEATIQQSRGANARTFSVKCTQALVGDETGCILLTTQQEDVSQVLKENEGKVVGILNVKMRSVGGTARLEVDAFSTVKPLADLQSQADVVPADFAESFEINRNQDRTKKRPKKPTFAKVSGLEPEKKNLNLLVKVSSVKITDRPRADGTVSKVAEAVVGDEEASINLLVRNEKAISLLEQDKVVAIFNAHIEMQKSQDKTNQSFMRLVVDRWGDVKNTGDLPAEILAADATLPQTVNTTDNKSQVEWLLQDE